MENKNSLMFIGDIVSSKEIRITRKPSIYDAFLLSNEPLAAFPTPTNESYQSIPLEEQANISIQMKNYHIVLSYQQNSLQIAETDQILTEEEVLEIFNNFIVRIEDRVTYLETSSYRKMRPRKKKNRRFLTAEKNLDNLSGQPKS
ncbi:hypothetical protein [Neobacillus cucumis]|uniref:Uncharacterized protein n=1 Tax=Neobacillus cucumis TaxID=1740721 RepID=A0A2N5HR88_9BACI|nr:hypothetical protein [Neobacillus cucumis]PLS08003.1 hypothetical protein CVD27_04820 [Neobacillus cucumis]